MENKYEANSKVFKAFCDENRLMILEILQSGEKCACHRGGCIAGFLRLRPA